ncbi:NAD-dependent epimerase/dehydratase family protein [Sulfoacidibacillus ferrooxidans]|uniref:dTDP-glucose 4,6-dehydratase n=1 Tax=Sulfoacidibacillus ferrooxidans TaxID=2005001 RepID=A0A9X2AFA6_9BACL|nr:NAD(P)-dependent oxidoreductase [Sulfoacidibacillus ferrooxidans]MCI0184227.1 dTDP-glucose 4,6-dehydratase [Sulfoacidibacillus ferrooxidans]
MNILITGGRGFVGKYIVRDLIANGHHVIDYNRDIYPPISSDLHFPVYGDLFDIPRLESLIRQFQVDRVIHTAGLSHPAVSVDVPLTTIKSNVFGTSCVLEACRLCGISRVILLSSECVYGETEISVDTEENHALHPTTPYGVSKAAIDMLGLVYNTQYQMDTISLRISQIYGPGQVMQEDIKDAVKMAISGQQYQRSFGRDQTFQFIHVEDVSRATIAACTVGDHQSNVYNITGGTITTLGEVLDLILELIPSFQFEVGEGNLGYEERGIFNISKAKQELNFFPSISLEDGIRSYVEWLGENLN